MRKGIIFALLFTAPVMVQAGVYTCEVNGRKVYQSTPCSPGDAPTRIDAPAPSDTPAVVNTRSVEELRKDLEERRARGREIVEQRAAEARERRLNKEAIRNKQVRLSMTKSDVLASWGRPSDINRSIRSSGVSEQWVYDRGRNGSQYVYFDNGIVTSISD
jgi:hypothetical protein